MSQEKRKWTAKPPPNSRKKSKPKLVKIKAPVFDKNRWKNKLPSAPVYLEEQKTPKIPHKRAKIKQIPVKITSKLGHDARRRLTGGSG